MTRFFIGTLPGGGAFAHLTQLNRLELTHLDINIIEPGAFIGLDALTELVMS